MSKGLRPAVGLVVGLCAVIGFLLPQQFSGVQKLQSLFIQADEQVVFHEACSAVALGAFPAAAIHAPQGCESITRARDVYEGLSYPEAKDAFQRDLFRDQAVFSALTACLGLLCYLALHLLARLIAAYRRTPHGANATLPNLGSVK